MSVVAPSVGQAEEVALPDVGVSLSYNARKFFSRPKERVKSRHFFSKSRENNTTAINWEQNIFFFPQTFMKHSLTKPHKNSKKAQI